MRAYQQSGVKLGLLKSTNESWTRVVIYISLMALYILGGSKVKAVSDILPTCLICQQNSQPETGAASMIISKHLPSKNILCIYTYVLCQNRSSLIKSSRSLSLPNLYYVVYSNIRALMSSQCCANHGFFFSYGLAIASPLPSHTLSFPPPLLANLW